MAALESARAMTGASVAVGACKRRISGKGGDTLNVEVTPKKDMMATSVHTQRSLILYQDHFHFELQLGTKTCFKSLSI